MRHGKKMILFLSVSSVNEEEAAHSQIIADAAIVRCFAS